MQPQIKLVPRFDQDGDKRLNVAERKAAREFLQQEIAASSGVEPEVVAATVEVRVSWYLRKRLLKLVADRLAT